MPFFLTYTKKQGVLIKQMHYTILCVISTCETHFREQLYKNYTCFVFWLFSQNIHILWSHGFDP